MIHGYIICIKDTNKNIAHTCWQSENIHRQTNTNTHTHTVAQFNRNIVGKMISKFDNNFTRSHHKSCVLIRVTFTIQYKRTLTVSETSWLILYRCQEFSYFSYYES